MRRILLCLGLASLLLVPAMAARAQSENQGVIATVNDQPITNFDITQRLKLMKLLGQDSEGADARKKALKALIDEVIKIGEAQKFKVAATEPQIDGQFDRVAKGLKTDRPGLHERLKAQGIAVSALRQFIAAQIGFNRILAGKYQVSTEVKPEEIDSKLAEIEKTAGKRIQEILNDPRMKPVTVYTILQINLPLDGGNEEMLAQLMQARAAEATQLIKRFTGCKNARAAAEGIFNVKIGKTMEADAAKLPKKLKDALDKIGPGKALGPIGSKDGVQVMGFCGVRKLTPPKPKFEMPTRQQVEVLLGNEKFAAAEEKAMKDLRLSAYIEYKDLAYSQ